MASDRRGAGAGAGQRAANESATGSPWQPVGGVRDPVMQLRNASVTYDDGESYVLNDVTLDVERGEILGIVGESGSGKSMLASAMLDAIPDPGLLSGGVRYHPSGGTEPVDVLDLDQSALRALRWEEVSMVFQGAMSSFNPTMRIGYHFRETIAAHDADADRGMDRAYELLSDLYLDPKRVLNAYPHELSGGMQQRALIALSLVLDPEVLVMDEPTAALDLLMQRSILQLLEELSEKYDLTMVFITHDLPLVAALADRLAVMYAFDLVEVGPTHELVQHAAHPYTRALLNSTPNLDAPLDEMEPIPGQSPAPINLPSGCPYHPRCPLADDECRTADPDFADVGIGGAGGPGGAGGVGGVGGAGGAGTDGHGTSDHGAACYHPDASREEIPLNYADSLGDTAGDSAAGGDSAGRGEGPAGDGGGSS